MKASDREKETPKHDFKSGMRAKTCEPPENREQSRAGSEAGEIWRDVSDGRARCTLLDQSRDGTSFALSCFGNSTQTVPFH